MGIATWFGSAAVAFALGRTVLTRSRLSFPAEITLSCVTACLYGLLATALDFGGWNEPDWRSAAFGFLGAITSLALARAVVIRRARPAQ